MSDSARRSYGVPRAGEVYVEIRVIGNYAKATAIDAESGIEASVVGPSNAAPSDLKKLAARRLEQVLARRGE